MEVFEYRKSQVGTAYSAAENAVAETANTIGHCSFTSLMFVGKESPPVTSEQL